MKLCDYCGRENQSDSLACEECGTPFPAQAVSDGENLVEPAVAKGLTPGRATVILFSYLGGFIEQCLESPGSELDTAVATCFLENVAGESFTSALAQHLGSRARHFLAEYGSA